MNFLAFSDEFLKLSAITREEAGEALKKLKKLEAEKLTAGELARGGMTGAIVGPGAALASKAVSGELTRGIKGGVTTALKGAGPGRLGKGKALGKALVGGVRGLGGSAASGAVFGAGLPVVRRKFDVGAEKEKLEQYLGKSRRGRFAGEVKKTLGV